LTKDSEAIEGNAGRAYLAKLSVGDKSTDSAVVFEEGPLKGLVKIDFPAIGLYLLLPILMLSANAVV
jgi:hypothetical protein